MPADPNPALTLQVMAQLDMSGNVIVCPVQGGAGLAVPALMQNMLLGGLVITQCECSLPSLAYSVYTGIGRGHGAVAQCGVGTTTTPRVACNGGAFPKVRNICMFSGVCATILLCATCNIYTYAIVCEVK